MSPTEYHTLARAIDLETIRCLEAPTVRQARYHAARAGALAQIRRLLRRMDADPDCRFDWPMPLRDQPANQTPSSSPKSPA